MLLIPDNKKPEDYTDWIREVGQRSELGVELNVLISYSTDGQPDWQIRGVVGVPRPPEDDLERQILANKLADEVKDPDFAVFKRIGLAAWSERTGGPFAVDVIQSRAIREVTESDVSNRFESSSPGPLSDPVFRKRFDEAADWARAYSENRYLRFESRHELNQRYQDLLKNLTILTAVGAVDLTEDQHWHRLFRDVVGEMFKRGQPPVAENLDPTVQKAILFPDEDLCMRAAKAVSAIRAPRDHLIKYGKLEDMRRLYRSGQVYMNSASFYDQPERHNQAVYDKERVSVYKGAVIHESRKTYVQRERFHANPLIVTKPGYDFVSMISVPDATDQDVVVLEIGTTHDFWLYCMSDTLMPRLFCDFEAEACVVIDRREFVRRMEEQWRRSMSTVGNLAFGPVQYNDPLGAFGEGAWRSRQTNFFTKTFRYAYQSEFRFVGLPTPQRESLTHIELELGSLDDIGALVVLE